MFAGSTCLFPGGYHLRQSAPLLAEDLDLDALLESPAKSVAKIAGANGLSGKIGVDAKVRSASVIDGPLAHSAVQRLQLEIESVFGGFLEELGFSKRTYDGNQIVVYGPGDQFRAHRDVGKNFPNRRLSLVLCIEMSCVGGELAFPDANVVIRSKPGDLIVFAPSILHASLPILSGRKSVFVTWLVSS